MLLPLGSSALVLSHIPKAYSKADSQSISVLMVVMQFFIHSNLFIRIFIDLIYIERILREQSASCLQAFFLALPRQPKLLPAALSYIRSLPVGPKDYTCVINACAKARNVDSAIEVLEIMKERGVGASFFDYSGVISTAAKAGDYHRAVGLFRRAREGRVMICSFRRDFWDNS